MDSVCDAWSQVRGAAAGVGGAGDGGGQGHHVHRARVLQLRGLRRQQGIQA